MKAVLTVEFYAPHIGGAERVVQKVAEGLVTRGHEAVVVTTGRRSTETLNGVRVERFPLGGNAKAGIRGDPAPPLELIRNESPDVLFNYACQTWTSDLCSTLLDDPGRPAMVLAPCGFSALGKRGWDGYFAGLRQLLPRYDALIFHSERYRDWDFAVEAGAESRHVIPNGADVIERPEREGDRNAGLLLTVGSHRRGKGHPDFARVLREVRRHRPARGVIAAPARRGSEAIRGCYLRCRARAAFPGNGLELVEGRDRDAVERAFATAGVFLLPSAVECSPLVIIEAMSAGLPWVSYDVGNVRELAGGLVVDDVASMAAAATQILAGEHPDLGKQGRELWARRHRWEQIVPRYEEVLERALDTRRAASPSDTFAARPD
jgi:glycosyltransferase involved in cell wall biosynthesis